MMRRSTHPEGALQQAIADFSLIWQQTGEQWQDPARAALAEECIEPLLVELQAGVRAMNELSALLSSAHAVCAPAADGV